MTKTRELEILDRAIAALGPDSYLGPWLADARPEIARDISIDFQIRADYPRQALRQAADIVANATQEYADTIDAAHAQATAIIAAARVIVETARNDAARDLHQAAASVERCANAIAR
jgi:hypothetical protein